MGLREEFLAKFARLKAELAAQLRELSDIAGRLAPAAERETPPSPVDAGARIASGVAGRTGAGDAARPVVPAEDETEAGAGVATGFRVAAREASTALAAAPVVASSTAPSTATSTPMPSWRNRARSSPSATATGASSGIEEQGT